MRKLCPTSAECYRLRLISTVTVVWVAILWFCHFAPIFFIMRLRWIFTVI